MKVKDLYDLCWKYFIIKMAGNEREREKGEREGKVEAKLL